MNRFSQKFIAVSRNLDGFSLANQGWFAKLTKLSPCQTFPLYGNFVHNYLQFSINNGTQCMYVCILCMCDECSIDVK